jgi:methyltransferase family protein
MNYDGFQNYMNDGINRVEGWVAAGISDSLIIIGKCQHEMAISGGALEIGVHHGKFIIALSWLLRRGEYALAIDIFGNQWMNIDKSGEGAAEKFKSNWAQFANPDALLAIMQTDSIAIGIGQKFRIVTDYGTFRLISIDGGHTVPHVVNDLLLCHDLMSEGGVVLLDDFLNRHWPGVHEGFDRYMQSYSPRLRPFLVSNNKLFLSSVTFGERYVEITKAALESCSTFKMVAMHGYNVVVI